MTLEESQKENDEKVVKHDITFLLSKKQSIYFQNKTLDFSKGIFGKGKFKLKNI
ncbi:hypothetical protein PRVXT_000412 [Proteinivorax tanatarense]|uniref:Uncharacterized protein n=1 Tax=Proteinivorax tanatarense TaxID=1260629 RepID=A0AAU7VNF6_9FIRM